jgi:AcrR family transcriptional regulator
VTVRSLTLSQLRPGDVATHAKTISADDVAAFAEISGDFKPVHRLRACREIPRLSPTQGKRPYETHRSRKPDTIPRRMSSVSRTSRPTRRPRGRPRDARADQAILAAALEAMAEAGVRDLRVDDVAARAGVGKATIYRRYRSKDALVAAAVSGQVSEITIPDTGSTEGDLRELMLGAVRVYSGSLQADVMPGLVEAMRRDPELARAIRDGFLARRRSALRRVLERAVDRGDLRADLDYELALDVLGGPLFYRLLVTGGQIDDQLADGVVELMMHGFAPRPVRRKKT